MASIYWDAPPKLHAYHDNNTNEYVELDVA